MNNQNWRIYVPIGLFVLASIIAFSQYGQRTIIEDKLECREKCADEAKQNGSGLDGFIECFKRCE